MLWPRMIKNRKGVKKNRGGYLEKIIKISIVMSNLFKDLHYRVILTGVIGPLFLIMLIGCNDHRYLEILLRAEQVMDEDPDSAYNLIAKFDTNFLRSDTDSALFNLLLTQAEIKTSRSTTVNVDELGEASTIFRNKKGNKHRLMLALLYQGQQASNLQEYDKAIAPLLEAEQLAIQLNDYFYLGLIDRNISIVYSAIFSDQLAIEYSEKAVRAFFKTEKVDYWNYERMNLASVYSRVGNLVKAKELLDSVVDIAKQTDDGLILESVHKYYFYIDYSQGNWEDAISHFQQITNEEKEEQLKLTQCAIECYDQLGMHETAESLLKSLPEDYPNVETRHEYYAKLGNYHQAYEELNKSYNNITPIIKNLISQNVISEANQYEELVLDREKENRRVERYRSTMITILLLAVSTIIIVLFIYRRKIRDKELQIIRSDNQILKDEIQRLNVADNEKDSRILAFWNELYHKQFVLIDGLFIDYENASSAKKSHLLSHAIERQFNDLRHDSSFRSKVFEDINRHHKNIIDELLKSGVSLPDEELSLLGYLMAGLSNPTMAILLTITPNALYTRKNRLKNKILNSDFTRRHELLNLI